MRRAKKDSATRCLRCTLWVLPCHTGTLSGSCTECGRPQLTDPVTTFDGFFDKELCGHLSALTEAPDYGLSISDEDVLKIETTNSNGLRNSHRLYTQNGFLPSNGHLKYQLDQTVWLHYIPNIRCRTSTTSLITSALFGRGYLSILFPSTIVNEAETFADRFRLFNISLIRLDESIAEVLNGFNKVKVPGDDRYWSEVSASLAILYFGLQHAREGLKDGSIQPLLGDANLGGLLAQRIESTLAHLAHLLRDRLSCDTGWASILDGSLEDLRSNVKTFSLSARIMKETGLMSTMSRSATSSGSTSISATSTPLSSIYSTPPEGSDTGNSDTSAGIVGLDTGPRPPSTPSTKLPSSPGVQVQGSNFFNIIPPSPTSSEKQNFLFSPLPTFQYGHTSTVSESPPVPTIYPSQGSGFSNLMLPEPLLNLQALGMRHSIPIEIEQNASYVSDPFSYLYDTRGETSVMASRHLFPDLHFNTSISEEGIFAD